MVKKRCPDRDRDSPLKASSRRARPNIGGAQAALPWLDIALKAAEQATEESCPKAASQTRVVRPPKLSHEYNLNVC